MKISPEAKRLAAVAKNSDKEDAADAKDTSSEEVAEKKSGKHSKAASRKKNNCPDCGMPKNFCKC